MQKEIREDRTLFQAINSNLFKFLDKRLEDKYIFFNLIGGEPTLYPLEELFSSLINLKKYSFCLTTNFSQPLDYYLNLGEKTSLSSLKVSFHHEFADIKSFLEKALEIKNRGINTSICSVLNEDTIGYCDQISAFCKKQDIACNIQQDRRSKNTVSDYFDHSLYDTYTLTKKDGSQEFIGKIDEFCYQNKISTKGMLCDEPKHSLYILQNGDVVYNIACGYTSIGNIITGEKHDISDKDLYIRCNSDRGCFCKTSYFIINDEN